MAQQTSVEFLWRWWMDNPFASYEEGVEAYRKAKEIHHQEIIHSVTFGQNNSYVFKKEDTKAAKKYYKETFNTK